MLQGRHRQGVGFGIGAVHHQVRERGLKRPEVQFVFSSSDDPGFHNNDLNEYWRG